MHAQMAPEHFAGRICPASDIYSLGVTLWEMCHQERPFAPYTQGTRARDTWLGHPIQWMGLHCQARQLVFSAEMSGIKQTCCLLADLW
jgi:serine/threonine protein kinase